MKGGSRSLFEVSAHPLNYVQKNDEDIETIVISDSEDEMNNEVEAYGDEEAINPQTNEAEVIVISDDSTTSEESEASKGYNFPYSGYPKQHIAGTSSAYTGEIEDSVSDDSENLPSPLSHVMKDISFEKMPESMLQNFDEILAEGPNVEPTHDAPETNALSVQDIENVEGNEIIWN